MFGQWSALRRRRSVCQYVSVPEVSSENVEVSVCQYGSAPESRCASLVVCHSVRISASQNVSMTIRQNVSASDSVTVCQCHVNMSLFDGHHSPTDSNTQPNLTTPTSPHPTPDAGNPSLAPAKGIVPCPCPRTSDTGRYLSMVFMKRKHTPFSSRMVAY